MRTRIGVAALAAGLFACGLPSSSEVAAESAVLIGAEHGPRARITTHGAHLSLGDRSVAVGVTRFGRADGPMVEPRAAEPVSRAGRVARAIDDTAEEWWIGAARGLEHGVTFARPPSGAGPLVVDVGFDGLVARPAGRDGVLLADAEDRVVASYAGLYAYDADGVGLEASMQVIDGAVRLVVDDSAARYPVVIDPLVSMEAATLRPSMRSDLDFFGSHVSVSGDGMRAFAATEPLGSGVPMAAVFTRSGSAWTEEALLIPPATAAGDSHCGISATMSRDGSRAMVGCPFAVTSAGPGNSGVAEVFVRSGGTWSPEATLSLTGPGASGHEFGYALALDLDGTRALVGVPYEDTATGADAGGVRVFVRVGSSWVQEAALYPTTPQTNARFGISIALSEDGTIAVIGAHAEDTAFGDAAGAAYVFVREDTTWSQRGRLQPERGGIGHQFGHAVALSGDGALVLVGSPNFSASPGGAWFFARSGMDWLPLAELPGPTGAIHFGGVVSLAGRGTRAFVSMIESATRAGRVAVFEESGGAWLEAPSLVPSSVPPLGPFEYFYYGASHSVDAEGSTFVIGVTSDDGGRGTVRVVEVAEGAPCVMSSDCGVGEVCDARGVCVTGGAPLDAGIADAGSAGRDAAAGADAGIVARTDSAVAADGATRIDGGSSPSTTDGGCSCRSASRVGRRGAGACLVLGLAALSRRRRA